MDTYTNESTFTADGIPLNVQPNQTQALIKEGCHGEKYSLSALVCCNDDSSKKSELFEEIYFFYIHTFLYI